LDVVLQKSPVPKRQAWTRDICTRRGTDINIRDINIWIYYSPHFARFQILMAVKKKN